MWRQDSAVGYRQRSRFIKQIEKRNHNNGASHSTFSREKKSKAKLRQTKIFHLKQLMILSIRYTANLPLRLKNGIQLFRERLSEEMRTRQSRKVIWDTLFKLSNLLLFLSFTTRKHMSVASRTILSNFFKEKCPQSHPQYLSGLSRALFSDNLSRNSCILANRLLQELTL